MLTFILARYQAGNLFMVIGPLKNIYELISLEVIYLAPVVCVVMCSIPKDTKEVQEKLAMPISIN